jgi:hypothetical protein
LALSITKMQEPTESLPKKRQAQIWSGLVSFLMLLRRSDAWGVNQCRTTRFLCRLYHCCTTFRLGSHLRRGGGAKRRVVRLRSQVVASHNGDCVSSPRCHLRDGRIRL